MINFATKRGKDKLALTMTVMAAAHRLLIINSTITRRSLYYDLKNDKTLNLVPVQGYLDQAVNRVANLLNCSPWELSKCLMTLIKIPRDLIIIILLILFNYVNL